MDDEGAAPASQLLRRHAEEEIREALADTRVVLVNGARQSGKSTLIRQVARGEAGETSDAFKLSSAVE